MNFLEKLHHIDTTFCGIHHCLRLETTEVMSIYYLPTLIDIRSKWHFDSADHETLSTVIMSWT